MESSKYNKKEIGEAKISQTLLDAAEELLNKAGIEDKILSKLPRQHLTIVNQERGIVRGQVVELFVFPSEQTQKLDDVSI